ncbi:Spindle pole body-associated protein sad1 [Diplodia seriata]|uniref:Spindle pole body-associated protein sad1 n=2 Tax=Diplodia seriata TaxID=420778 RepID=A0A1S8BFT2_9PEZI|nr:Spindle pole body-associated protein sad1 [Diplodia seriata]
MANNLLLENAWTALHAVNFFSRSLGAVVDPHLTSPTMASRGLARRALQKLTWIPGDLPPAAALVAWEEPTDCWCAARSPGSGKAQIGVIMPYKIVPETLLVEHIPRDGTLDIGSAPRGMEVWVEVEDEGVRAAFPAIEDRPREKFVRVGSFEYKVDALNHVQAFNLNSELLTPVNKVVVRVTGTWGRDWTCLYRLRMNGRPVDEFNGYSE